MDQQFVSEPMDLNHKEGNDEDFDKTKTFDLSGNDNDQMLKMYLRKAGLSDNIEYLTSEQRRAFIYDIVKSNKNPGYWKPSVLPETPLRTPSEKKRFQRDSMISLASITDIPPAAETFDLSKYREVKNTNSSLNRGQITSPISADQKINSGSSSNLNGKFFKKFSSKQNQQAPRPPSHFPTTTHINRKGRRIEISGPNNFQHIEGDMVRDKTKNTFDLSGSLNNNTLKKYMIERGISEEDVKWLDRKDLIRRIVQSNFTWMPPQSQTLEGAIPPPPSETYVAAEQTPTSSVQNSNVSKGGAIIVTPPVLPTNVAESEENVYEEIVPPKRKITTSMRRMRRKDRPPPPPVPVDSKKKSASIIPQDLANKLGKLLINKPIDGIPLPPLPPPSNRNDETLKGERTEHTQEPLVSVSVDTTQRSTSVLPQHLTNDISLPTSPSPSTPNKETPKSQSCSSSPPPPPPPPPPPSSHSVLPKEPTQRTENCSRPLKVPTKPRTSKPFTNNRESKPAVPPKPKQTGGESDRNAFLLSIQNGVTLKKVTNQEKHLKYTVGEAQKLKTPPVPKKQVPELDFMSELRNATLKRFTKLEINPSASESEC